MSSSTPHDQRIGQTVAKLGSIPNYSRLAGILLIISATALVYSPSLHGAFFLDDQRFMAENPLILASDGYLSFWNTRDQLEYHPLSYSALWLQWRIWGTDTTGYHVTNYALHVISALLIWKCLAELSIPGAFLAALLFTVHPNNVESVAWIFQIRGLLATTFMLSSIVCYLKADSQSSNGLNAEVWYGVSLFAFLCSTLSKGSVVMLPAVLLMLIWWRRGRIAIRDVARLLPFLVIAIALTAVILWFRTHGTGESIRHLSLAQRSAGAGAVIWFSLSKDLAPIQLSVIYPYWNVRTGDLLWWLPLSAVIALTCVLWWLRNSKQSQWVRPLLFAWGYFCIALIPVLGFVETNGITLVANRYQHLAIIGLVSLAAAAWSYWHRENNIGIRWAANSLAAISVGVLGWLAWQQSSLYGDPIKMYEVTLATNPNSDALALLHNNLGSALLAAGRSAEAMEYFQKVLQLKPDTPEAHHNLANALMSNGQIRAAIEHYQQALKLRPDYAKTHCNLGIALMASGQTQDAIDHLQQALQLDPDYAEAHYFLANALNSTGRSAEARGQYELAVQCNPQYVDAHDRLGNLLVQMGRLPEAIYHFQQVVRYQPHNAKAEGNLAIALASTGQMQQAIEHFQLSLKLEPNNAATHHNLGVALAGADRLPEAVDEFTAALQLQPNRLPTLAKLTTVYALLQQPEKAIATAEKSLELARSTGQTKLAAQVEDWLSKYRANLPTQSGKDTASP